MQGKTRRARRTVYPLKVYGIATKYALDWIADDASMFLIHPPMHTYTLEEISIIPTAVAYHKLFVLQHHRTTKLREILRGEELFPHHYGECPKHAGSANALWCHKKDGLFGEVDSGASFRGLRCDSRADCPEIIRDGRCGRDGGVP